jgi:hypothetical protein
VIHRRPQYGCLCSSSRNCLETGYVSPCVSRTPPKMPVMIFFHCCSVFACEHPRTSFSCTSCY